MVLFRKENIMGMENFYLRLESLADDFEGGVVLVCDIVDFYNQIYLHRINNVLSEGVQRMEKLLKIF
jgi:hypothetical protein